MQTKPSDVGSPDWVELYRDNILCRMALGIITEEECERLLDQVTEAKLNFAGIKPRSKT